jgi:hypothetical protein
MRQSEAWVLQAKSDLAAARRVLREDDPTTFCQAIAKYQQVVEKSVKAMIAAINELGVAGTILTISGRHTLEHEVNQLDGLRRKKPGLDDASVDVIDRLLTRHKNAIGRLCSLAPKLPGAGSAYPVNTEYPFNDASPGGGTAPAAPETCVLRDVLEAQKRAWPLHHSAARFASSLRRRR